MQVDKVSPQKESYTSRVSSDLQPAFMPNASDLNEVRRYLAWNNIGTVVARYDGLTTHLEVEFADTSKYKNISMAKNFKINCATVSSNAVLLAGPNTILYCQITTWAPNTDWSISLSKGEEVKVIAAGDQFVAVGTSRDYVRIFSASGVQKQTFKLGPIVSMVGSGDYLAIVYYQGTQMLLTLIDYSQRKAILHEKSLCLFTGTELRWIGFSEENVLYRLDSKGVLCALSHWSPSCDYGGLWCVVLETEEKKIWPIHVFQNRKIRYLPLSGDAVAPSQVIPRPVPSSMDLQIPFLNIDSKNTQLEEKHARESINLNYFKHSLEILGDSSNPDLLSMQLDLDKTLLLLLHYACQADKSEKALDLANSLILRGSLNMAVKLVQQNNLGTLAEHISNLSNKFSDSVPSNHKNDSYSLTEDSSSEPPTKKRKLTEAHVPTSPQSIAEDEEVPQEEREDGDAEVIEDDLASNDENQPIIVSSKDSKTSNNYKANPFAKVDNNSPTPKSASLLDAFSKMKKKPPPKPSNVTGSRKRKISQ